MRTSWFYPFSPGTQACAGVRLGVTPGSLRRGVDSSALWPLAESPFLPESFPRGGGPWVSRSAPCQGSNPDLNASG